MAKAAAAGLFHIYMNIYIPTELSVNKAHPWTWSHVISGHLTALHQDWPLETTIPVKHAFSSSCNKKKKTFSEGKTDLTPRKSRFITGQSSSIALGKHNLQREGSWSAAKTHIWGWDPNSGLSDSRVPALSLPELPPWWSRGSQRCWFSVPQDPFSSFQSFPPLLWEPHFPPASSGRLGPAPPTHARESEATQGCPPGAWAFRALSLPVEWEVRSLTVSNIRASGPHKACPVSMTKNGSVLRRQYRKRMLFCSTKTYAS